MSQQGRWPTAEGYDELFTDYERSPKLAEILRSALDEALPPEVEPFSFVTVDALREVAATLRLAAGDLLVDLACGRGGPGMWVARTSGANLVGIDYSPVAIAQAGRRVPAFGLAGTADFRVGTLAATGLPDATADAVMCVDAFHFAPDRSRAAAEVRRVLRPGGRLAMTNWEPREPEDAELPERFVRLDFAALLGSAGLTDVEVMERPGWQDRHRAVYQAALALDTDGDPGLEKLRSEANEALPRMHLLRRVLVTAVRPR